MEQETQHQEELTKILGLGNNDFRTMKKTATWAEIYTAIGRLKERAEKPQEIRYVPSSEPHPLGQPNFNQNLHYHNGTPCYNNPCIWC